MSVGVGVGGLAGLVNGLAITRLRVTPFVATLGMLSIAPGLAVWLAGRKTISFPAARPGWVDALSQATVDRYLFDPGVWSMFALAVLMALVLRRTVFGRYCYAIGSNEATARLCGIAVERTKVTDLPAGRPADRLGRHPGVRPGQRRRSRFAASAWN